jgi:hypothetical protein
MKLMAQLLALQVWPVAFIGMRYPASDLRTGGSAQAVHQ